MVSYLLNRKLDAHILNLLGKIGKFRIAQQAFTKMEGNCTAKSGFRKLQRRNKRNTFYNAEYPSSITRDMAGFFSIFGSKICIDLNSIKAWSGTSGLFLTSSVSRVEYFTPITQFYTLHSLQVNTD